MQKPSNSALARQTHSLSGTKQIPNDLNDAN
jgi:hypothetical protein